MAVVICQRELQRQPFGNPEQVYQSRDNDAKAEPAIPNYWRAEIARAGLHDLMPWDCPDRGWIDPLDETEMQHEVRHMFGRLMNAVGIRQRLEVSPDLVAIERGSVPEWFEEVAPFVNMHGEVDLEDIDTNSIAGPTTIPVLYRLSAKETGEDI